VDRRPATGLFPTSRALRRARRSRPARAARSGSGRSTRSPRRSRKCATPCVDQVPQRAGPAAPAEGRGGAAATVPSAVPGQGHGVRRGALVTDLVRPRGSGRRGARRHRASARQHSHGAPRDHARLVEDAARHAVRSGGDRDRLLGRSAGHPSRGHEADWRGHVRSAGAPVPSQWPAPVSLRTRSSAESATRAAAGCAARH
jgi:hypothetical protein